MSGIVAQNAGRHTGLVKAASAGGEWTLIKTLTASADSTLEFEDGTSDVILDSTYDEYCFRFINIHPSGDGAQLKWQANAAGGSGYNETITSTAVQAYHTEDASSSGLALQGGYDLAQGTGFQPLLGNVSNDNDSSGSGYLHLYGLGSTTFVKQFQSVFTEVEDGANAPIAYVFIAGYINTTSAIDEIQFKFDSGNIDAGTISLYGIG